LVKRLVAHELILSFVPDVTQRLWRTVARRKYQSTCNRVQLQNRLECLLEEMHIKLSSLVADLIGPSARRMLRAIASGETDPGAVAGLGSRRLHATPDQFRDALGACTDLHPVYRRRLALTLDELEVIERHIHQLGAELAQLLRLHQDTVERLAAVPGLGVDSAQQIITEVEVSAITSSLFRLPRTLQHDCDSLSTLAGRAEKMIGISGAWARLSRATAATTGPAARDGARRRAGGSSNPRSGVRRATRLAGSGDVSAPPGRPPEYRFPRLSVPWTLYRYDLQKCAERADT
jgi:hypothetical protein